MIIKTFDAGWGPEFPAKQFEQSLLDQLLATIKTNDSQTILINSTWYTQEYHQAVLSWLRANTFDHIIVVAMLDCAIPHLDWYSEFNCQVTGIGYYPGEYCIDYWALLMNQYHKSSEIHMLLNASTIQTAFMSLNRKPHWHRVKFYNHMKSLNLLEQGLVSMGGERFLNIDVPHDTLAPNAAPGEYGIPNDLISLGHFNNWIHSFLNIVTETVYDINHNHFVSEKIFKPILGCRPFLVYDPDGATKWLTDRGFKTYTEDFKDISNLDLTQPDNIAPFLTVLCQQGSNYWQKKFIDLREKIVYNKQNFADYIQSQQAIIDKGL